MKRLFESADRYLARCGWQDMALLKFCLFSMGLLAGTAVAPKCKPAVRIAAAVVFVITYIPLMIKYLGCLLEKDFE